MSLWTDDTHCATMIYRFAITFDQLLPVLPQSRSMTARGPVTPTVIPLRSNSDPFARPIHHQPTPIDNKIDFMILLRRSLRLHLNSSTRHPDNACVTPTTSAAPGHPTLCSMYNNWPTFDPSMSRFLTFRC
uniref:Uncharacterized protein n=1 Tax=Panagrellus redivivus TaxID=6233 RepID=A0A7E4V4B4_PANRE